MDLKYLKFETEGKSSLTMSVLDFRELMFSDQCKDLIAPIENKGLLDAHKEVLEKELGVKIFFNDITFVNSDGERQRQLPRGTYIVR